MVLNATYMRQNVQVTDAAIVAGVHLVDLGSYYPETLQQLGVHDRAVAAGSRIVPGCGVAPGLTNILARHGADRLDSVEAVRLYSYITHPMWTSPGIVVTRFDASVGTSVVLEAGRLVERPSFSGDGDARLPGAVRRTGGPPRSPPRAGDAAALPRRGRRRRSRSATRPTRRERIRVLLELGFDATEPFIVDGVEISPVRFAAALHRPARHRSDGPECQRQAGPRRRYPRRASGHARLRLRGRAGRAVGLVGDHRDGRRDRRRHGRAGRPGRGHPARGRIRCRAHSWRRSRSAG